VQVIWLSCGQPERHADNLDVSSTKAAMTVWSMLSLLQLRVTSGTEVVQVLHTAVPMTCLHMQGQNLALCDV